MTVVKRRIKINGREYVEYEVNGKAYRKLTELLLYEFRDHGEFYEKIFGVNRKDAADAGWMPGWNVFLPENPGFRKFIEDRGKIHKEIYEETLPLRQVVEEELFKD